MRGKRFETEKVIATFKGNQYVDSGGYPLDDHQKQPKTNENLAKEYGVYISGGNQYTKASSVQFEQLVKPFTSETLAGEYGVLLMIDER